MTHTVDGAFRLDREQELMSNLIDQSDPNATPEQRGLGLLRALGEVSATLNTPDNGTSQARRWQAAYSDLGTVLVLAADLASHFDVALYPDDKWPDGTHVGGDGVVLRWPDPHHLLAELLEAAGWVASWIRDQSICDRPARSAWQHAEPITELVARTWCLVDRIDGRAQVREQLRGQIHELVRSTAVTSGDR